MTQAVSERYTPVDQSKARRLIRHNQQQCVLFAAGKAMYLGNTFTTTYYLAKGLNHADIYLLQVFLYIASFLAGLPLGRLADKRGSRFVLVLGTVLAVVQSTLFAFAESFWQFAPLLMLVGVQLATWANNSHALMDFSINCLEATQVVGTHKDRAAKELHRRLYERFLARETRAHGMGYALGVLIGNGLFAAWDIRAPFLAQPFLYVLCLLPALRMQQPPMVKSQAVMRFRDMWAAGCDTLRDRKIRSLTLLAVFANCVALTCFWELQPRMEMAGIKEQHFMWGYLAYAFVTTAIARHCSWLVKRQHLGWGSSLG